MKRTLLLAATVLAVGFSAAGAPAQTTAPTQRQRVATRPVAAPGGANQPRPGDFPPGDMFGGFGGRGGFGGMGQKQNLVPKFDKDGDGRLDKQERQAAYASLKSQRGGGFGGFGGRGGFGPGGRGNRQAPKPGARVAPADVKTYPDAELYDPTVLRTIFIEFEDAEWEPMMAAFKNTGIDMPATLTVDGKTYPNVGVHFRGMSSFSMVGEGFKRSLSISMTCVDKKQRLYGYKNLNLNNGNDDPSFIHTVLYSHVARQYIPAPKANLVKVVINGENWGIYSNVQQFDEAFLKDFKEMTGSGKGVRWKVPGSPNGRGSLAYLGEDVPAYERIYTIKTTNKEEAAEAWKAFVALCRTLQQTPADKLEEALSPIFDIDGALWFLAIENALVNGDGYWTRTSDYNIFLDSNGKIHIFPHDMNESFQPAMGFGMGGFGGRGGRGGRGGFGGGGGMAQGGAANSPVGLDPLVAANDTSKVLLNKLLAVPSLKQRYLQHVRTIAEQSLDWNKLGPVIERYHAMIAKEVEADTRKLETTEAFQAAFGEGAAEAGGRGMRSMSLRQFAEQRRSFLLNHPAVKVAAGGDSPAVAKVEVGMRKSSDGK